MNQSDDSDSASLKMWFDAMGGTDARSMSRAFDVHSMIHTFPALLTVAFLVSKQEKNILNPFSALDWCFCVCVCGVFFSVLCVRR